MSKRTQRIQILVDLAKTEQENALTELGQLQSQKTEHQAQLESLNQYLQSYIDDINLTGMTLMPIQLHTTQGFINKLNLAINGQKEQVQALEMAIEKARQVWFEKRARVEAMQKLWDKVSQKEQFKLDKQEQSMLDDLASQQFLKVGL